MKKYPVVSKKDNKYLANIKRHSHFGMKITLKTERYKNIFITVYKSFTHSYDCSRIVDQVKEAVDSYEKKLQIENDNLKGMKEFKRWDGKIE